MDTYEKKYNEALEMACNLYAGVHSHNKAMLEQIFPELRESKDERIRKGLIEVVSDIAGGWPFEEHRITKKEALAYLEKQKEQKPTEWSEEDDMLMDELESYILYDKDFNDEQKSWRIKRLKSLRPQPHWKPSEQEKGALRTAIYVLTEERNFPKAAEHLQAILDAFDSKESRKDFKPSEEQMNALKDVAYGTYQNGDGPALRELYEQLQKLM